MKIIGLFSGILLFSVLCLLPEVRAECFTSVSEDELCEKCIIKQLLNSVFAWYHESSKPRVCVTDLGFDNSWYHAQPHPIIVYCLWYKLHFFSLSKTDILLFDAIGFSEAAVKAVIKLVYLTHHRYRWSLVLSVLLVTLSVLSQVYK